ncbi:MAG: hypothetical protein IVW55_07565 [Chloroflexi bacterium]|nr:hypothetical protein [Chloroflexota bacterium]
MADVEENRAHEQPWKVRLLNESQRRSLATVARRVELAAWHLEERLLRETPPQLALTRFTDPPDSAQRTALLRLVQHVRQEVATLAVDYHLAVTQESFVRSTIGEFTLLWCDLEDSRPQKLQRYGALNPQADEVLGPPIQRLIELMLAMSDVTGGKQESIRLWQEVVHDTPEGREG